MIKGHDSAELIFANDEVSNFLNARYVGPPEACWRLFAFKMHDKSHVVERFLGPVLRYLSIYLIVNSLLIQIIKTTSGRRQGRLGGLLNVSEFIVGNQCVHVF